ncbi:MFS transporter [Arthrobacter sp.]|uniref:MFS transporter n=1 Tax=Arthrobacter sp. TaxID=1667 RepID=UPI002811D31C|nr:MFS transporter [Arthrobacter sp.]
MPFVATAKASSKTGSLPLAAMLVLAAIGFTAITTELLPSGLLPQMAEDFDVGESQVGLLTVAYAGIVVVTVVPMARLCSRLPRQALLLGLVVTFALSNVLLALSPEFSLAVVARLIGGVAHGLLWSTMAPYIAALVPEHMLGRAMAVVFSGNSLGLAVGAPAGTALGAWVGWRTSFLIMAATGAVLALLALWLLPSVRGSRKGQPPSVLQAIRQPGVKSVTLAWPLMLFARFAVFTYIAPFILAAGLPSQAISISLSVVGAVSFAGLWIAGMTVDSRPRRSLIAAAATVVGACLLLPWAGTTLPGAYCLMALWGAALGACGIYNQAAILRAGKEHSDAANSLMVLATQLGIAIGAAYGGLALSLAGPLLVPVAAALPAAVALGAVIAGRKAGYPPGPKEGGKETGASSRPAAAAGGPGLPSSRSR